MELPVLIDWKSQSYNSILIMDLKSESYDSDFVIIDQFTKMVYYKLVKIMIDVLSLAEVIINIIIRHYGLFNFIIIDQNSLFI